MPRRKTRGPSGRATNGERQPSRAVASRTSGAGAKRPPDPELYPTLTLPARALYDRAVLTLKARGHTLRVREERNELAVVCWVLALVAIPSRLVADKSPVAQQKGAKLWKKMEKLLWVATVVMTRRGWVDGTCRPGELEEVFGIGRLLPHMKKRRRPRRPGPRGGRAA